MGMFSGVESAKASFDAKYLGQGHYLCRIDRVKADKTRAGKDFLAVEMTVIHTFPDGDGDKTKWHRPGEAVSHLMMAEHDSFKGNVKAMISNLFGVKENEVTEQDCVTMCSEAQPLGGMIAEIKARDILTKKGNPFTTIRYVREFPAAEIQDTIDEGLLDTFFPGDTLEKMIEEEANEG